MCDCESPPARKFHKTTDPPCPCLSELEMSLRTPWKPFHSTPADQSTSPSQSRSLQNPITQTASSYPFVTVVTNHSDSPTT